MKTDVFQACGYCSVFQICWHIKCNTLTISSFRFLNSWNSIPSTSFDGSNVPKAHLTSHSNMSISRGVTTPLWLYGSLRCVFREGNGHPLQYSCLENPMDGGAWWAAFHEVAKSRTRLSDFTFTFHFHALEKEMATHSSVLAWRIPGMAEPGGLPSMGSHRVGHD